MTKEEFKLWAEKNGWLCWGRHRDAGRTIAPLDRFDEVWMTPTGRLVVTCWRGETGEFDVLLTKAQSPSQYL